MPPQRERERRERRKENHPRAGKNKNVHSAGSLLPEKNKSSRALQDNNNNNNNNNKKKEEEEEDKKGKRRTGALSLDVVGICTIIFSFVFSFQARLILCEARTKMVKLLFFEFRVVYKTLK